MPPGRKMWMMEVAMGLKRLHGRHVQRLGLHAQQSGQSQAQPCGRADLQKVATT